MSNISGLTSGNSNYFSSMLGTDSSSKNSTDVSSLLSNSGSSSLSDLALIKSGAYKKLLNAYYNRDNASSDSAQGIDKTEKLNLTTAADNATSLKNAVWQLTSTDIVDANRAALKNSLKDVVESYNKLIDSGSEVDNSSVLRQTLWMTQGTTALSKTLTDLGITIGDGNKLKFDEEKFDSADLSVMKTAFLGKDSYMGKLSSRADMITKAANNAIGKKTTGTGYNNSGNYTSIPVGNIIDEKN